MDGQFLSSAEVFDPRTGAFGQPVSMMSNRVGSTATLLPNGTVLLAGTFCWTPDVLDEPSSAELFDPVTSTFALTGSMLARRSGHTATLLLDGRVLVTGGWDGLERLASAEIYQ